MKRGLLLVYLLVGVLLSACGLDQPEPDVTATQTASVPTPTPTPFPIRLEADGSGDYSTLEEAVAAALPGETIFLEAGVYRLTEPLDIDKPLTLIGVGMDQVEIISEAEGYVVRAVTAGVFAAEGITFRHEGKAMADVVLVQGGEVSFVRCRFTGAVYVEGRGNKAGLRFLGSSSGLVRECLVMENNNTGILMEQGAHPILDNNVCADNEMIGIGYFDKTGGVARQNECLRNVVGIGVATQSQPTLDHNICRDNELYGIAYWDSAGGMAYKNECTGNGVGISIGGAASPELIENDCHDNTKEDILDERP